MKTSAGCFSCCRKNMDNRGKWTGSGANPIKSQPPTLCIFVLPFHSFAKVIFYKRSIPGLFFLLFVFSSNWPIITFENKFYCRCWDSNRGSVVSANCATTPSSKLLPKLIRIRLGTSAFSSNLGKRPGSKNVESWCPMHCFTSLKIVVELWCYQGTLSATCICLLFW